MGALIGARPLMLAFGVVGAFRLRRRQRGRLGTRVPVSPAAGHPRSAGGAQAIASLEYQSCEHDGWVDSEARVFRQALRRVAITELPGDSAAEGWLIETRTIFQPRRSTPRGAPRSGQR